MDIKYYVMKRATRKNGADARIRTCETVEQAWAHIQDMPERKRADYFVQYSSDALAAYKRRKAS